MNPTSWKYNNYGNKDTIPCENKYAIFIGRYQPYHKGHTELIEQKINEGRPVLIMVRDVPVDDNNPFTTVQTMSIIRKYHESKAHKNVMVIMVPDIESVNWGRGVGYEMNEFEPPENIGSISATEIRNSIKEENDDWKESVDESIHTIIKKYLN
tara:strand:+ start:6097 stop:6558 length:462 start_codon:yes stop_codon:yes gene_type:complete